MPTTLLVEDHPLFKEGVAMLMAREFPQRRLLQAGTLAEARAHLMQEADIDLVLLDLGLPDSAGLAGLVELRRAAARPRYVVLSSRDDQATILAAIEHGAAGYVCKTSQAGAMLAALRMVMQGGVFLPANAGHASVLKPDNEASVIESLAITPRQADVLRLLVEGKSNKMISRELNIADSTVKTHLATVFRVLEVSSRVQAVVAVAAMGLLLRP